MSQVFLKTATQDSVATPPAVYADLDRHFHFDFDPCPLQPTFDGLSPATAWGTCNYVNPPFSCIGDWVARAVASRARCIMLLPFRINTKYWREHVLPNARVMYAFTKPMAFPGYGNRPFPTPIVAIVLDPCDVAGATSRSLPEPPVLTEIGGYPVVTMTMTRSTASR